jgi:2-dehydro-3-deoxyphosphogluconate aldolase / (4S)-4-hydroxy-2-oxoglutarate aldolase
MVMTSAVERMILCSIIPVVVLPEAQMAKPLAEALLSGGIDVIEITLRNEAGLAGIEQVARHVPQMLPVAGTVINGQQMRQVADAGAQLVVSPGFSSEVDMAAKAVELPWLPGVATATECMQALGAGRRFCKFFPAIQAGGMAMIKALGGPFPGLAFCPTGGITTENLAGFLALSNVRCAGGSWIAPPELIAARDWAAITGRAAAARAVVKAALNAA